MALAAKERFRLRHPNSTEFTLIFLVSYVLKYTDVIKVPTTSSDVFSVQHFSYMDVLVYILYCFTPHVLSTHQFFLCVFVCLSVCLCLYPSVYLCLSLPPLSPSSSPGLSVPSTSSVPGSQAHLFHERLSACLIACLLADWKEVWSEQGVDWNERVWLDRKCHEK